MDQSASQHMQTTPAIPAYLRSVIDVLGDLRADTDDDVIIAAIDNCVCTLAGVVSMMTPAGTPEGIEAFMAAVGHPFALSGVAGARLTSPPDSLGVNPATAGAIARAAAWIDEHGWEPEGDAGDAIRGMVREETQLSRQAYDRLLDIDARLKARADTIASRADDNHDEQRVARYFASERAGMLKGELIAFTPLSGGRSRQTMLATIAREQGEQLDLVIQRDNPVAGKHQSATDEFPLLGLLHRQGLPVPEPLGVETDPQWLGAPFLIVRKVAGQPAGLDYFRPPQAPGLARDLAVTLARLHAIKGYEQLGLRSTLGEPASLTWAEDLGGLSEKWSALRNWPSISASAALAWMTAHVDLIEDASAIVHGDPTFHNILCHGEHVSALLDWELAHVGHPAEDLGYCRGAISAIMPWEDFISAYEAAGGGRFSQTTLDYFSLRASLNIIVLIQKIRATFQAGLSDNIGFADLGASFIPRLMHRLSLVIDTVLESETVKKRAPTNV